ncbi:MAG: M50 family metallopeptidase [Planctomycetota bacterium]
MSLSTTAFGLRLLLCVAFASPVGYVAYISGVAIHELLGHGVTAWLLGGTFQGFALMPDGMGWAVSSAPKSENIVLAGGVIVGMAFGLFLLPLAYRFTHPLARMTCLLFAVCSFEDAAPYVFWNSVFPRPPGDFGRILLDLQSEWLRWSLVVGFGTAYIATSVGCSIAVFRCFESLLGCLTKVQAIILAWVFFGLGGGIAWFGFDWNQLIQDVGRLPQFAGAALQFAIAPILVATRGKERPAISVSNRCWVVSITSAWFAAGLLVAVLLLWLQHGLFWNEE